jgi:uncharacterized iron-regulated membrane protein
VTKAVLRRLHRWIGLALAVPLMLQALTGLFLAADPFAAAFAGIPSANGPLTRPDDLRPVDAAAILVAAHGAVSAGLAPSRWRVLPNAIIAVDFASPGQQQPVSQVGMDVVSMTPLWVRQNPDSLYRWVHSVHETLLLGLAGRSLVGWIGVGLLLLALSGIPLWWPPRRRWKTGFTVTPNARGWRLQRDLHGAAGIWVLLLLLLQSVSGIALAFPQTARTIVGLPAQPPRGVRPQSDRPPNSQQNDPNATIAAGIAAAQAALPAATLEDLRLPPMPDRPMMAVLRPDGDWQGLPRAVVIMDPATARILSIQDPRTSPTGLSVLNWLRAIHEGGAAGPAGRLAMCLVGVALTLLPVTGLAMWTLRQRRRRRAQTVAVAGQ